LCCGIAAEVSEKIENEIEDKSKKDVSTSAHGPSDPINCLRSSNCPNSEDEKSVEKVEKFCLA